MHVLVRRLLAELDRVAGLAGVPYFLAYGTALGAVREGDLIPWDVDADVWLPHEHQAAFLERAVPLLGADFELLTAETHPDYEYLFPRLVLRGVHHVFVRVDVFPLDAAPRSAAAGAAYLRLMHLLAQVLFVKRARTDLRHHYSRRKVLLTRALRMVAAPVPERVLLRVFRRLQAGRAGSPVLVNSCGSYGARELLDAAWFADVVRRPLGPLALPLPVGHDPLLTQVYGDWRTPVPPERQQAELAHAERCFVEPLREAGVLS